MINILNYAISEVEVIKLEEGDCQEHDDAGVVLVTLQGLPTVHLQDDAHAVQHCHAAAGRPWLRGPRAGAGGIQKVGARVHGGGYEVLRAVLDCHGEAKGGAGAGH